MLVRVLYPSYTNPHVMHRVEGGTAHWIEVGFQCLCGYDVQSVEGAAEIMFGLWNGGSGSESPAFRTACVRSLSTGDVLVFPEYETTLQCASIGWVRTSLAGESIAKAWVGLEPLNEVVGMWDNFTHRVSGWG